MKPCAELAAPCASPYGRRGFPLWLPRCGRRFQPRGRGGDGCDNRAVGTDAASTIQVDGRPFRAKKMRILWFATPAFKQFETGSGTIDREEFAESMQLLGLRLRAELFDFLFKQWDEQARKKAEEERERKAAEDRQAAEAARKTAAEEAQREEERKRLAAEAEARKKAEEDTRRKKEEEEAAARKKKEEAAAA